MRGSHVKGSSRQGFTLVELMITLVILAVLAAIAVPSMRELIARKRVEGVANELASDLRYLRSEQIERGGRINRRMGIRFSISSNGDTCYVLYEEDTAFGASCNCINEPACTPEKWFELKTVKLAAGSGMQITAVPSTLYLTGSGGLPAGDETLRVSVSATHGGSIRIDTNQVARPSMCSVTGHHSGLSACPTQP